MVFRADITLKAAAVTALLVAVAMANELALPTTARESGGASVSEARIIQRQREGTQLVDMPGYFKITGDRATFFAGDGSAKYDGLENLNLERVAAVTSENPEQLEWLVSGTITEYRGANYLLVSKAVLRNKHQRNLRNEKLPAPRDSQPPAYRTP